MILLTLIPFFVSWLAGFCLVSLMVPCPKTEERPARMMLAGGVGLGISAFIGFASLVVLNRYNGFFVLAAHLILLAFLLVHYNRANFSLSELGRKESVRISAGILLLGAALVPAWGVGRFYPMGGWDAWQVWNLKAKFILLGGTGWQRMLAPSLWQTSPHYPLLLPLVNVWGWSLQQEPSAATPQAAAFLYTLLTLFLLWAALYAVTRKPLLSVLPCLLVLSNNFFVTLAMSQYADIVVSYYLLAGLYCLLLAGRQTHRGYTVLAGLFFGMLGFCKPEGGVIALIALALGPLWMIWLKGKELRIKAAAAALFGACLLLSLTPAVLFKLLYSPGNQNFINGLTSTAKPATVLRLKMILAFLWVELKSAKWNFIWLIPTAGLLLGMLMLFKGTVPQRGQSLFSWREMAIFPAVLFAYFLVVLGYYYVNTSFEIAWWLQVSLHRILFTLLAPVLFWTSAVVFRENSSQ